MATHPMIDRETIKTYLNPMTPLDTGIVPKLGDAGEIKASGKQKRQQFGLKQGIDKDASRKIVKLIKDTKLKVQSQVQGEQVRVTGKKRDDLQDFLPPSSTLTPSSSSGHRSWSAIRCRFWGDDAVGC